MPTFPSAYLAVFYQCLIHCLVPASVCSPGWMGGATGTQIYGTLCSEVYSTQPSRVHPPHISDLFNCWMECLLLLPRDKHCSFTSYSSSMTLCSVVGCSPWGREESDTTEWLHFHFSRPCIGEGNGNPLQCSCLENPRDGGAWWAAVYGVAQSLTRLRRLSSSSSNNNIY